MGEETTTEDERRRIEAQLPSLIDRLKRCASPAGVVSHRAFALEAERLGLRTDEQQRGLREGLVALGIRVQSSRRAGAKHRPVSEADLHVGAATPATKVSVPPSVAAPESGFATTEAAPRLAGARRMMARYADEQGTVTELAHAGVARLHGLSLAEVRALTADFPITSTGWSGASGASARTVTGRRTRSVLPESPAPNAARSKSPVDKKRARSSASAADDRLSDAVRVARAVLEEDRWRRNPGGVVLKADEEVGLALLLRGDANCLDRDVLEEEIAALPRDGERWHAYECLVRHNQRLVWKIAQGHQGRGLDIDDLVQHGSIGLLRAVRKFDATMGTKFSTYATWWIKQTITRAIADEGALIRLPVHLHERVGKVALAERRLLSEGRPRTVENVAFATGLTFAQVETVRRVSRPTDSLDRIIGGDVTLGDLVVGPSRLPGPPAVAIRKEFHARVRHVLEHLPERERYILVRRTGLDGDEPDTLETIGAVFGVTRERIRQLEPKAKGKFHDELVRHGIVPSHL